MREIANRLAETEAHQQQAMDAARERPACGAPLHQGAADYLEVVTAQAAELDARRADVELRTCRLVASIDLSRALDAFTGIEPRNSKQHYERLCWIAYS